MRFLLVVATLSAAWLAEGPAPGFLDPCTRHRLSVANENRDLRLVAPAADAAFTEEEQETRFVYVLPGGTIYHRRDCPSLKGAGVPTRPADLGRYSTPCSICKPTLPSDSHDETGGWYSTGPGESNRVVYLLPGGTMYHRSDCPTLRGRGVPKLVSHLGTGPVPCSICKPDDEPVETAAPASPTYPAPRSPRALAPAVPSSGATTRGLSVYVVAPSVSTSIEARNVRRRLGWIEVLQPRDAEAVMVMVRSSLRNPMNFRYDSFKDLVRDADMQLNISGPTFHCYLCRAGAGLEGDSTRELGGG